MDAKTGITAKLAIGNFAAWSDQLKAYLMSKNLYKYVVGAEETKLNTYEYTAPDSTMTTTEREYLLSEQAKDRVKLQMFMGSDDQQAKGILLASISPEMVRSLIEVLKMDDTKVIATQTCKAVYDALKTYALSVEKPMVLVRKQAYRALKQMVNETISDYINRVDDAQAQLTLSDSGFSQVELYDKIEETLLPRYENELRMNSHHKADGGSAPYNWLCVQLRAYEHNETIRMLSNSDAPVNERAYVANGRMAPVRSADPSRPIATPGGQQSGIQRGYTGRGRTRGRGSGGRGDLRGLQPRQSQPIGQDRTYKDLPDGRRVPVCTICHQPGHIAKWCTDERSMQQQPQQRAYFGNHDVEADYSYEQPLQQPQQHYQNPPQFAPQQGTSYQIPQWRVDQQQRHEAFVAQGRAQQYPQQNSFRSTQSHHDMARDCNGTWFCDSGSSGHMTPHEELFTSYVSLQSYIPIEFGGGDIVPAIGYGTVTLPNGVQLVDVLHVPMLAVNLLSISAFLFMGLDVLFRAIGRKVIFSYLDAVVMTASQHNSLFVLDVVTNDSISNVRVSALLAGQLQSASLWHRRFAHLNYAALANMQRLGLIPGCTVTPAQFMQAARDPCEPCIQAKAVKVSHPTNEDKTDVLLGLVSFDMTGPVNTSLNGEVYFIDAADSASSLTRGACLKSKTEAVQFVKDTIILWERQVQAPGLHLVQRIRTDNGLEFCNNALDSFLYARGIVHETTTPYTSQQNGKIERFMRTIMTLVRALLACAGLSTRFWAYAALLAVDIHNWTVQAHAKISPYTKFYGRPVPSVQLRPFGSPAWVLLPHENVKKLDDRVRTQGVFVGYKQPAGSKQYLVLIKGKVYTSCNVTFDERMPAARIAPVPVPVPAVQVPMSSSVFRVHDLSAKSSKLLPMDQLHHPLIKFGLDEFGNGMLYRESESGSADTTASMSRSTDTTASISGSADSTTSVSGDTVDTESHNSDASLPDDPFEQNYENPLFDPVQAQNADNGEEANLPHPPIPQSVPASGARSKRTKNPNWRAEQGYVFVANTSPPYIYPCKRVKTGGPSVGVVERLDVLLDARNGMQPSIRQRNNRTGEQWTIPPSLCTTVPYMPSQEAPYVPGDMSRMPRTIDEALARPDADKWREALETELGAMRNNKVYALAFLPEGASAVGCRMIFDIKQPSGRYKCRLVAQGYTQVYGVDYDETYAPVASMTTLRVFYAMCARYDLVIRQLDVSTAFLHAPLEERVYMKQLNSLRHGSAKEVWELFKAIYGLKQAPRA